MVFSRSGLSVPFDGHILTLLELAEACDVPVRWSCRTGVCHTCAVPLLSGEVRYSPVPLQPAGNGEVLLCCATPTNDIVIDA